MKTKRLLLAAIWVAWLPLKAQILPNASFDSVYFGGIDRLFEWITADGFRMATGSNWQDTVNGLTPNTTYLGGGFQFHELLWLNNRSDTSSLSLASTVVINRPNFKKQDGSPFPGFLLAGNSLRTDAQGYPDYSRCGIPFAARPLKLAGFYHFVDSSGSLSNSGKCYLLLKKWNATTGASDTVGYAESLFQLGTTGGFTPFELLINYRSTAMPDSLVLVFEASASSGLKTELWLDELGFMYSGFGMQEEKQANLIAYPNPTKDLLHLTLEGFFTYRIYNLDGQLLRNGTANKTISLGGLPAAWLVIEVIDEDNYTHIFKILKTP